MHILYIHSVQEPTGQVQDLRLKRTWTGPEIDKNKQGQECDIIYCTQEQTVITLNDGRVVMVVVVVVEAIVVVAAIVVVVVIVMVVLVIVVIVLLIVVFRLGDCRGRLGDCVVVLVIVVVVLVIVVVVLAIACRNGGGFGRRSHRGGFRFKLETDTFLHAVDNWKLATT